jgi:hypothetical protein
MREGAPDYDSLEWRERAMDTIANVLHAYYDTVEVDLEEMKDAPIELVETVRFNVARAAVDSALLHFEAEVFVDDIEEGFRDAEEGDEGE